LPENRSEHEKKCFRTPQKWVVTEETEIERGLSFLRGIGISSYTKMNQELWLDCADRSWDDNKGGSAIGKASEEPSTWRTGGKGDSLEGFH
jgi:hypothetical protein